MNEANQYGPKNRPAKVLDAMHGVAGAYHGVTVYPLMDALNLLLQKPVAYCFILRDESSLEYRRVISNFADQELLADLDKTVPPRGNWKHLAQGFSIDLPRSRTSLLPETKTLAVRPFTIRTTKEGRVKFAPFGAGGCDADTVLIRRFVGLLSRDTSDSTQRVLEALEAMALKGVRKPKRACPDPARPGSSATRRIEESVLTNIRRNIIDFALDQVRRDPVASDLGSISITNAFCVVRRALHADEPKRLGIFDYTARVVLASHQQRAIRAYLKRSSGVKHAAIKTALEDIEEPLGERYRSIADSVFASGTTDYTYEPYGAGRDINRGNKDVKDEKRRDAEHFIFSAIGAAENRTFYIAIHVGGVPWIALFGLAAENKGAVDDRVWEHNYLFYRIAPRIADHVRIAAAKCYCDELASRLERFFKSQTFADRATLAGHLTLLNEEWRDLSAFFPYDLVQVVPVENDKHPETTFDLPSGIKVRLRLSPNPHTCFTKNRISFDLLDVQAVKARLMLSVQLIEARKYREEQANENAQMLERAELAHTSKTILNQVYNLIRKGRDPRHDEKERREALRVAEQYALFIGQDAGVLQQVVEDQVRTSTPLLALFDAQEIETAVKLCAKFICAVNQLVYSSQRHYFVSSESVANLMPSDHLDLLRIHIQSLYTRKKIPFDSRRWKFRSDPIFCLLFFTLREVIDNMRPRDEAEEWAERHLDITSVNVHEAEEVLGSIAFLQRVPRQGAFENMSPFDGLEFVESLERFNARYGRQSRYRFAEWTTEVVPSTQDFHLVRQEVHFLRPKSR
jgi:hypothetical protein